jgi:hypothetical protein
MWRNALITDHPMRHAHSILGLAALALLAAACGESNGPEYLITSLSGDRQADSVGRALAVPLSIRVTDAAGVPQAGLAVRWDVTQGATAVVPAAPVTDAAGEASAAVTLGGTQGLQLVRARVGSDQFVFNLYAFGTGLLLTSIPIPQNYGIHDTYVRDGIAFVCAWNDGVRIYDVGNGIRGGTPWLPVLVSRLKSPGWGRAHNAWWFHNPNTPEARYLFVGEEGPSSFGNTSSGDIHVLDVSDLANPVDVATFRVPGAGTHNFWMDESAEILYAAYYNAGVLKIDVSGTLSGNLEAVRRLSAFEPTDGGGNTFTWGVQLAANGSLYAIDMLSGLWQLAPGPPLAAQSGSGRNVLERYSSDLWVHGDYAYTGTWGYRAAQGNAVKIWHLDAAGVPVLADSIIAPGIGTVSDVEVSPDGKLLMFSAENGTGNGVYWYDITDPVNPVLSAHETVAGGVHTATFATIGGRLYAFAARNPPGPALVIYNVTQLMPP